MKHILLLIPLIVSFSACTVYHVTSQDTTLEYLPSKRTVNDVIYIEQLEQPHEVIAYITVNAERRQYFSEVLEKMKREAAILGGDAITNVKTDATGEWQKLPAQIIIGNAYVRANFTASVIIFK